MEKLEEARAIVILEKIYYGESVGKPLSYNEVAENSLFNREEIGQTLNFLVNQSLIRIGNKLKEGKTIPSYCSNSCSFFSAVEKLSSYFK